MATHLRLQWRDRTGISPDFPFKPSRAPWVCNSCTTLVRALASSQVYMQSCDRFNLVPLASRRRRVAVFLSGSCPLAGHSFLKAVQQ